MTKAMAPAAATELRANEKKWTKPLMEAGWTILPNIIFERQQALGLDPLDINILLHLAGYWWTAENKPHPSKVTIANAIGVDPRTVQRRIAAMEKAGFISRQQRRIAKQGSKTNIYDFAGLIKAATPYALEHIEERKKREATRKLKASKKGKPILTLVKTNDDE